MASIPRMNPFGLTIPSTLIAAAVIWSTGTQASIAVEPPGKQRPRVIVTTDGEEDDRCSMIRFLLTSNEFEVEGIVNSSSQFHWVGGKGWNAFQPPSWIKDQIGLYSRVHDNLRLHDPNYPTADYLLSRWKVGNIGADGEDELRTEGAEWIAEVLLDGSDTRPIWIQAWGGCNTISRALKIIQQEHPARMAEVAGKLRLFLIWEQDQTYQTYIRPNWERFNIPTIISDQFDCIAYIWRKVLPDATKRYFEAEWMKAHILNGKGPLCAAYEHQDGAFNAEGDTPAFLHAIPNGLRSDESPGWGGWGGRYIRIRHNVWMDPPPVEGWKHPDGQLSIHNSWSKKLENVSDPEMQANRTQYFKPIWRWLDAVQNDFAARADWCVKDYASANHHPIVRMKNRAWDLHASRGESVTLDASVSSDPDGDRLAFRWWHFAEAGTYSGALLAESNAARTMVTVPEDARPGDTIHMVCEVTDAGVPPLTRYQRVLIHVNGD